MKEFFSLTNSFLFDVLHNYEYESVLQYYKENKLMIWATLLLCSYLIYRYKLRPNKPKEVNCTKFNNKSIKFEAFRRKKFPKPYPNGWYNIAISSNLKKGQTKSVSALGIDVVIFRGMDNQIGVLDAFCPHLGAHLGVSGSVKGNNLECSFHGWRFNKEGECTHIPYTSKEVPCFARTRSWHFREKFGLIWLWFDADNSPPRYEISDVPEIEGSNPPYYYGGIIQMEFNQHISEMFENSTDFHHFNILHGPFPMPILDKFVKMRHKNELDLSFKNNANDDNKHLCSFTHYTTHFEFFGRFSIPVMLPQISKVTFEGPSIMHFRMQTPIGNFHVIKTLLPVKPFQLYTEDHWWADWKVPRLAGKLTAIVIKRAIEQDRTVLESKTYNSQPVFVEGDGPWRAIRSWFSQHYSPSSLDVSKSYLEW